MYLMSLVVRSLAGNEHVLRVVDKASKVPFSFSITQNLLQLYLTFSVPRAIRTDGGRGVTANVVPYLCSW